MKILIGGSSGFLGSRLFLFLQNKGHEVFKLDRSSPIQVEGMDAVVNLGGVNLFEKRWSKEQKEKIFNSRIEITQKIVQAINEAKSKPKVFLSSSAIGYYGDHGSDILTESSEATSGFLSEVCKAWERVSHCNARTVNLRTGIVLSDEGGIMKKLLPLYKLGLGAILGNGNQYMSYIHLQDWLDAVLFLIEREVSGPVNLCNPNSVTQKMFSEKLAKLLRKPHFLRIPKWFLSFIFGEMKEIFLTSIRANPEKLLNHGFKFRYASLHETLMEVIC